MGTRAETVGTMVDARSALERVQRTLEGLPENQRIAFVLCEIEGLSAREAADALGVNETAVWKRVSDARKALVRALKEADR
jgi:RNA polymerase sigma-70 factor (ECF subfamily)